VTCTDGKSVLVCFDYQQQKTIAIPGGWRDVFLKNTEEARI